jgi:hypothetical protein
MAANGHNVACVVSGLSLSDAALPPKKINPAILQRGWNRDRPDVQLRSHWLRSRVGMGPKRWAEWPAFMHARGLEWGKPLSDPPNAPAKPLGDGWNVYTLPDGVARAEALSRNGSIRRRLSAMYREAACLQRLATDLLGQDKNIAPWFVSLRVGLDGVWEHLQEKGIIAKGP